MSDPFTGEIMMTGFNFAPLNYAFCHGQMMQIAQNPALNSLIHTQFGGNGSSTFALPDMRGRAPMNKGNGINTGHFSGVETVTLTDNHTGHRHYLKGKNQDGTSPFPYNPATGEKYYLSNIPSTSSPLYSQASNLHSIAAGHISSEGDGQPHNNMQPCIAITFCIALEGIYPARN